MNTKILSLIVLLSSGSTVFAMDVNQNNLLIALSKTVYEHTDVIKGLRETLQEKDIEIQALKTDAAKVQQQLGVLQKKGNPRRPYLINIKD